MDSFQSDAFQSDSFQIAFAVGSDLTLSYQLREEVGSDLTLSYQVLSGILPIMDKKRLPGRIVIADRWPDTYDEELMFWIL